MPKVIKFKKIDKGWINPRTGKELESIEGLFNRKGIDEVVHRGYRYTIKMGQGQTIEETRDHVILELDITDAERDEIMLDESDLEPYELTPGEIETLLPAESAVTE